MISDKRIFELAEPFGEFRFGDAQGDKRIGFARVVEAEAQSNARAHYLALKANKEMLTAETARADKAEKQRDELLKALEGLALKVERDFAYACTPMQLVKARCVLKLVKGGA